jgi:tRNA 2-selenouridine synthase SelU
MINTLKNLFGLGPKVDYADLVKTIILDVRSPGEYKQGHIKGSLNTPLNDLSQHITKLKKRHHYYLLCIRDASASAKSI